MAKAKAAGCNDEVKDDDGVEGSGGIGDVDVEEISSDDIDTAPELLKQPDAPTAEEWREHQVLHVPFQELVPNMHSS